MRRLLLIFLSILCVVDINARIKREKINDDGFKWIKVTEYPFVGAETSDRKPLVPIEFWNIYVLKGYFVVNNSKGKGIYDLKGNCIISPDRGYDYISEINDNWFEITEGDFKGACDQKGNEVISPKRGYNRVKRHEDDLQTFRSDIVWYEVEKGGYIGVCDEQGREIIPPSFYSIRVFENYFHVTDISKKHEGIYDKNGHCIISSDRGYERIFTQNGWFEVQKSNLSGACDTQGREIVKPLYSSLIYSSGEFKTKVNGEWVLINDSNISNVTATAASRKNTPVGNKTTANASGSNNTRNSATMSEASAVKLFNDGLNYYNAGNYTKAMELWRKAAEQGDASAQYNLGICYYDGQGVSQNDVEAVKWFRKAAEQGYAKAQHNLGVGYYLGQGVSRNYVEAVKWFLMAAEQGDANAQYNLGVCYENGEGVSQNYAEAVKWYRKAAEQGLEKAQFRLGICYYDGQGVSQNYAEAVKWFHKAAEQGLEEAQFSLGYSYLEGLGVTENIDEAKKWLKKAADQGNGTAKWLLDGL